MTFKLIWFFLGGETCSNFNLILLSLLSLPLYDSFLKKINKKIKKWVDFKMFKVRINLFVY